MFLCFFVKAQPEPEYEVEKVFDKLTEENGQVFYLVKWVGFNVPTWEPLCNLEQAKELVDEFENGRNHAQGDQSDENEDVMMDFSTDEVADVTYATDEDELSNSEEDSDTEDEDDFLSVNLISQKQKKSKTTIATKLIDAIEAGTSTSASCTLILVEGDSALETVKSALFVLGTNKYGALPLQGTMLNVRCFPFEKTQSNFIVTRITESVGLKFNETYDTKDDLNKLRYGKVLVMPDADKGGTHFTGLVFNFFNFFWPTLMKLDFFGMIKTPIVNVNYNESILSFYTLEQFESWRQKIDTEAIFAVHYLKGNYFYKCLHSKHND